MLYIDMDGVLADFNTAIMNHLGGTCQEIGDETIQIEVPKIKDFWENIPLIPDMQELWDHVKQYDPFVLTASSGWDRDRCTIGKQTWLTKYLPDLKPEKILIVRRSHKANHAYGKRPHVLIDDYTKNIDEWHKAGGWGILHESAKATISVLKMPLIRMLFT